MNKYILLLLLLSSLDAAAQVAIKGTVRDKDSNTPIPDVIIQYGATSRDYVYTDANGRYSIPESGSDIIHFQCFGYKSRSVVKSELERNAVVLMELNPVSLNPIVISPGDADKLLEEVMMNTKEKLLTEVHVGYLLHFLQTRSDSLKNEVYLKYATTLPEKTLKKNLKKERVPYTFNIIDIRRLKKSETPTSELYGAEYHASHLFTFGKSINNETTRSYTSDSSLIILQIEPLKGKEGWARGEVVIRKEDMTISSMEIESVDSIMELQPYKKYLGNQVKVLRKVGRFEFAKAGDRYYMSNCYTYYKFRTINEYGREEDISYYCDVDCIGLLDKAKLRNRMLSGYCQELFYFPDSTQEEFWNSDYTADIQYLQHEFTGIAPSRKRSFINWKNALFFGAAVAGTILLVK